MACGFRLIASTVAALACAGISSSVAGNVAQSSPDQPGAGSYMKLAQANTANDPKKHPPAKPAPAAPAAAPPRPAAVAPVAPRHIAPAAAPIVAPKVVVPNAPNPVVAPRVVSPVPGNQNFVAPRNNAQRNFAAPGGAAAAAAIRGTNRATIGGRNYSVVRGSHRVYRGGYWRTFVGLGALGFITYGAYRYYPYAYIDAPPELCEGLTEDGCALQWQEVQTLEGPLDFQCVAYCPQQ